MERVMSAISQSKLGSLVGTASPQNFPTNAESYELLEECGRGVSATVWRARCKTLRDEIVAVKLLDLENVNCSLEEIIREAQTMRQQASQYVLPLHCSFVHQQNLWMVMPYVAGGSVLNIMKYAYPEGLEEPVIATILKEVLKGLDYMHRQGIIHRDVKAGNILIDSNGQVLLADFGVTATMERGGSWGNQQQARSTFVGTPCWMAPEVMEQARGYNELADIWSFGITILEMAHGHAPFARFPPMKVLLMTIQNPPPQLESDKKHFSKNMRDIVAKCLVKDPARRPTAAQLLEHKFFKTAHEGSYLVRNLLNNLPSVTERVRQMRQGKAPTRCSENELRGVQSQEAYVRGVSAWNFDVGALKASAAHEEEPALASIPEQQQMGSGPQDLTRQSTYSMGPMLDQPYTNGVVSQQPLLQSGSSADYLPYGQPPSRTGTASPGPLRSAAIAPGSGAMGGLERSSSNASRLPAANLSSAISSAGKPISKQGAKKQGRFEVYEGDSHPPMSPPNQQQPGAVMEQHLSRPSSLAAANDRPYGEELELSRQNSEAVRSVDMLQRASMSAQGQAPDPKRKGRFQIVEDDIVDNKLRPSRNVSSASLADKGLAVTSQQSTSQVLPVVRELQEGLAGQLERVKELAVALQDVERGKQASMSQLLQQVSDRRALRPGHADNERLRQENVKLREENVALGERLRYLEQELQHVSMQLQH
ncbi:hypothetical protein WJX84_009203 [Apatococcus fuscideae]|uniref:Protein kinase domain-containing protein n=1 Tax=Apatococcus fuscideae TaxID=2026836 RepID=A0AAW1T7K0_9CHLO